MNKVYIYILGILFLTACSEVDSFFEPDMGNAVELTGVEASVYGTSSTRAAALDKDNYVGRSVFVNNDEMTLTTIKRTASPIEGFYYHGIVYNHVVGAGQTSGGWNRDEDKGGTKANPTQVPERIYWSDAANPHTYIGYSVPQQADGTTFDWKNTMVYETTGADAAGIDTYYGSLGDPTVATGYIDHTDNTKIKYDDLLLTYDDQKVAETGGSVAKLYYHHALANVRVVVKISGFSATSESADARSVVKDMVLKDMLTMYKWKQMSNAAEALSETYDGDKMSELYTNLPSGHTVPSWNQKKDTHLWIPRPIGTGTGVGKQFTFYGLAVPTTMDANSLLLHFTVDYQNPMDPWKDANGTEPNMVSHPYTAIMPQTIEFRAGWCTTINITLNHDNEEMTVGAEYMDWQFMPTPDEGELKKNTTFLTHAERNKITIFGDDHATVDDATWLYIDDTPTYTENGKTYHQYSLRDIYGHYGTEDDPFIITEAEQLLSFAYEVKGTQRQSGDDKKYYNIVKGEEVVLTANAPFDFAGYYVKLDADLTLQHAYDVIEANYITWPGIGDKDHPFNGMFNGGFRHINKLYGEPFFNTIGPDGIIDHIFISDAIAIDGSGSIAEKNAGIICGSHVEGDIVGTANSKYSGSIVGINTGVLIACSHIGKIECISDTLGALLGRNDGIVVTCYNVGDAKNNNPKGAALAGIGNFTPRSVAYCCYFNRDFYTAHDYDDLKAVGTIGHVAFPLTTAEMQSNKYVNQPRVEINDAEGNVTSLSGEITDNEPKDYQNYDPFYYHWSMNAGLNRAIEFLTAALAGKPDIDETDIFFHAPGTDDGEGVDRVKLKKSQVQWLIAHYAGHIHQFQFIPGTYPKLQ